MYQFQAETRWFVTPRGLSHLQNGRARELLGKGGIKMQGTRRNLGVISERRPEAPQGRGASFGYRKRIHQAIIREKGQGELSSVKYKPETFLPNFGIIIKIRPNCWMNLLLQISIIGGRYIEVWSNSKLNSTK